MTDFIALATAIASQLDGAIKGHFGEDGAPVGNDIAWIDLANERAGLRVVLRRGLGAESTRLRATMSVTSECRGNADWRELPAFHELETAAALSREARVIAAQIEVKIIQPAIPMLATWTDRKAEMSARAAKLAAAVESFRARYPAATVSGEEINLHVAAGYIRGRINADGGLYVDRCSLDNTAALAVLDALAGR